jgi:uncharacterized integral membrane protein (TIGR00698 family)
MKLVWGLGLSLLVSLPAWFAGRALPIVGGPVFAILLGMAVAAWKRPPRFQEGIRFATKRVLQAAIVLLGFGMDLGNVARTGLESLLVLAFTVAAAFLAAWGASRLVRFEGKARMLIGVGTAICGGSAIAAVAPILGADDEEVAHSISTIFLFNVAAAFIFPVLGRILGMGDQGFGLWAGTAINDTSSVVAAGYSFSDAAGAYATVVKLTRTLLIIPTCVVLALVEARRAAGSGAKVDLVRIFPWFVLGFLAASLISTAGFLPSAATSGLAQTGKFLIIIAMSAIGLNTSLPRLFRNGFKPIVVGLACWVAVALSSLAVQALSGGW